MAAVLVLVLASCLAGCSTSVNYVGTSTQGVFFKVPKNWDVFDAEALKRLGLAVDAAANSQAAASGSSYTVYTSLAALSRRVVVKGTLDLFGADPWALANVVSFGPSDQSSMSLEGLNDLLFPLDTWQSDGLSIQQIGSTKLLVKGPCGAAGWPSKPTPRAAPSLSSRWPTSTAPPTRPGTWLWAALCRASRLTGGSLTASWIASPSRPGGHERCPEVRP